VKGKYYHWLKAALSGGKASSLRRQINARAVTDRAFVGTVENFGVH
jgi:hypothetical protein